ncbi:transporter [Lacinutrix sp. C3R15]|uniref:OmpP1/FadL family transporter n=1 Tax=Flavobacteriaceae TaxID=49546 RepID=UPI001C08A04B|nr:MULTISPECIES: transporter [Flavobacteriaceae]MBU2939447.1 transporter [Lacinutrix sp. C3R15]MDO6622762.1 transporter [Oceanihabitans sp. 1_MG-2023]
MKKGILLCIGFISMSLTQAQDITDALRFAKDDVQGTARYRALSGAFGALGGDMSAVAINPAGSSVFNDSHISISLTNQNNKTDTQYFNEKNNTTESTVDLNQIGAAFVFDINQKNSNWKKFTLGITYNKIEDYNNDWFAYGTNSNNSIDSYFLENANGLRLDEISRFQGETYADAYSDIGYFYGDQNQQAFLGYESYILEPETDSDDNTLYSSNIADGEFYQEHTYAATGYNGKFTINASTQYGENLYFGLNVNTHFINYERSTYLFEGNNNAGSLINEVGFQNNLKTIGSGVSFQFGGILKIAKQLRVGLTYDTPTWYTIEDETSQSIKTLSYDGIALEDGSTFYDININPRVINVYEQYNLRTPGKLTGSFAYVFGTNGLISFDYSIKDYGNTKFKPTSDAYFSYQNNIINENLTTASTYKIGGEYKIKQFSLRGGYRFEESPYKNQETVGDLNGYSLGLGYNFGNLKLDLTFDQYKRETNYQLYQVGLTDAANLDSKNSNVTMSVSFNL